MHDALAIAARIRHHVARVYIDLEAQLYAKTGNPMHACQAAYYARQARLPQPDWVQRFFAEAARALIERGARTPRAITEALGLQVRGGCSRQTQAATTRRDLAIADAIASVRRARRAHPDLRRPHDLVSVQGDVAAQHGVSQEQVARIWHKYRDLATS